MGLPIEHYGKQETQNKLKREITAHVELDATLIEANIPLNGLTAVRLHAAISEIFRLTNNNN